MISIALLQGCTFWAPDDALSVEQVVEDLPKINGSKVTIVGWTGEHCGGLDCRIFRSPKDARIVDHWDHEAHEIDENWQDAYDHSINVCWDGTNTALISKVMLKTRVLASGTLAADCKINGGCFDGCDFKVDSVVRLES